MGSSFLGHLSPLAHQAQAPGTHSAGRAPKALHPNSGFAADEEFSSNSSSISQGCGDTQQLELLRESIAEDGEAAFELVQGTEGIGGVPASPPGSAQTRQDLSGSILTSLHLWLHWERGGGSSFWGSAAHPHCPGISSSF